MKQSQSHTMSGLLMGMAAGAAAGAAGMYLAGQSERERKRMVKKMARGAEHAMDSMENMLGQFTMR